MSTPRRLAPRSIGTPRMRIFCPMRFSPEMRREQRTSRIYAIEHTREGYDFADVLGSANPCNRALQAQPESRVRHAAVTAQVEIPLKRFLREIILAQSLDQRVVIREALSPSDDFAVAFRGDHVETERQLGPRRVGRHIKGLHRRRVAMNNDRFVEVFGNDRFLIAAKVVSELRWIVVLIEDFDGFFVRDPREWRLDFFQLRDFAFDHFEFARTIFDAGLNYRADKALAKNHHVFQVRVSRLRLEHPEFGEMPPSLRFFGAKCWPKAIHLAERGGRGLDVKLAGLREIGFLVVNVIHFEKRRCAFAGCGSENGRVGERVALGVHEIACRAHCFRSNPKDCRLPRRTNPQMALIEKEIDAVFFELNGERPRIRHALNYIHPIDVELKTSWRTRLGVHCSGDNDTRFLREILRSAECFGMFLLGDYTLNHTGAVAKNGEEEFAGFAHIVEPALNRHFLTDMLSNAINRHYRHQ